MALDPAERRLDATKNPQMPHLLPTRHVTRDASLQHADASRREHLYRTTRSLHAPVSDIMVHSRERRLARCNRKLAKRGERQGAQREARSSDTPCTTTKWVVCSDQRLSTLRESRIAIPRTGKLEMLRDFRDRRAHRRIARLCSRLLVVRGQHSTPRHAAAHPRKQSGNSDGDELSKPRLRASS